MEAHAFYWIGRGQVSLEGAHPSLRVQGHTEHQHYGSKDVSALPDQYNQKYEQVATAPTYNWSPQQGAPEGRRTSNKCKEISKLKLTNRP